MEIYIRCGIRLADFEIQGIFPIKLEIQRTEGVTIEWIISAKVVLVLKIKESNLNNIKTANGS